MNKILLTIFFLFNLLLSSVFSQNIVLGPEFLVIGNNKANIREPRIASDCQGNYVIVVTSKVNQQYEEDIYFKKNTSNNSTLIPLELANMSNIGSQYRPSVAMTCDGRFVITWTSNEGDDTGLDIVAQIYEKNGSTKSGEFLVNTTRQNSQNNSEVACDKNGDFVVVWHSWQNEQNDRDIFAQKFSSTGEQIGEEFQVNSYKPYSQAKPSIAMAPNGNFVVCWESWKQNDTSNNDYDIYAQLYDKNCKKIGNEFRVNSYTKNDQFFSNVSMNEKGDFLIVWTSWEQDGDKGGIFGQKFFANGEPNGNEFQINTTTKEYQWLPKSVLFNDGSFAVTWSSWLQDGSREAVVFQLFNSRGEKTGKEITLNEHKANYQWEPSITKLSEKEMLVVWSSYDQFKTGGYDIYGRKLFIK